MKIAVIAANGQAGQLITKEAVERGHKVVAIVRSENKSVAKNVIQKDLLELTKEDLANFDIVINAFGGWTPETLKIHSTGVEHLTSLLANTDIRFLVVGGAGSLFIDEELTTSLADTPDFPADYLPVATAMRDGLNLLRTKENVNWTYISPAADFDAEAPKTGNYTFAGEVFTTNSKGESFISYADYASAMLDEVEKGNNIKKRISVLGA